MTDNIRSLMKTYSIMFVYGVHNMQRAVKWYQDVLGLDIIFEGGGCHTEFALPVKGARLALSLIDTDIPIQKAARLFIPTHDIYAVEAYLKKKGVNTKPIENIHNVTLILWVEDPEGNHFAFEQWVNRT